MNQKDTVEEIRDKIAARLANNRAHSKGGLDIENVLDVLPQHLKDEVYKDADDVIKIANEAITQAHQDGIREALETLENLVPKEEDVTDVINDWIIPELKKHLQSHLK